MKNRPSLLAFLAAALTLGGGFRIPQTQMSAPHGGGFGKRGGGKPDAAPWRERRFRAFRGIACPDWQNGEPLYPV